MKSMLRKAGEDHEGGDLFGDERVSKHNTSGWVVSCRLRRAGELGKRGVEK